MRWFVEISTLGPKPDPSTTLCVEAPQWQPALQKARALRGDVGALSNFTIELLEDGFRAVDPVARQRYEVKRAPADATLSSGAVSLVTVKPKTPAAEEEVLKKRPPAQTMAFMSTGAAAVVSEREPTAAAAAPAPAAASTAPVRPTPVPATTPAAAGALPRFDVISKREDTPSERSPLNYRELVYAVAPGTTEEDARLLILERFEHVRATMEQARPGKLINLAIFDHRFQGRPLRRPIVTLAWKDWKSEAPEVVFPLRDGIATNPPSGPISGAPLTPAPATPAPATPAPAPATPAPATPAAAPWTTPAIVPPPPSAATLLAAIPPAPALAAPAPVAAAPAPATAPASAPATAPAAASASAPAAAAAAAPVATPPTTSTPATSKSAPAAAKATTPVPPAPPAAPAAAASPPQVKKPAKPAKRLSGEDLISELFESFGDLHFLRDSLEGAEFVLALTLEKLPSEVGIVSLFDINKREFVVVRQVGGPRSALCQRQPERATLAITAMRKRHAVVISDAAAAARASDERWASIGVELRTLICAPVELGGRYLGLIELANPLDGSVFNEGDGNALTYIGGQFAEFVASRGVIIDSEAIIKAAEPPAPAKKGR